MTCALDDSLQQWLKCLQVCSKVKLSVWNFSEYCSLALAIFLCRIICLFFGEEFLPRSAETYWWFWHLVSLSGDVCCTCKRPQIKHTFRVKENMSWIGNQSLPVYILLRPEMQMQGSTRVIGKQDQVLGNSTFMFWLYFDKYWVYMINLFLLSFVLDKAVNWLSAVLSYLFYDCSLWSVWFVAQHDCVLGLCLTALEQHRRMLGLAHRGLGITKNQPWTIFGNTRAM